jgi:hypothetical protein
MKLITELLEKVDYLEETTSSGSKALYITGPFMQYDTVNRNGRLYSKGVMEKEVHRYTRELINENRAYGELNHPKGPQIDLERVCILIKELNIQSDGKVYGKARVTETPKGQIVKGLMESGANLGVSSRGLGSLKENEKGIMEVQDDFRLVTASDVVADPSAPAAFVKGIMEGAEWLYNEETGEFIESCHKNLKKKSKREIEEAQIEMFKAFLRKL